MARPQRAVARKVEVEPANTEPDATKTISGVIPFPSNRKSNLAICALLFLATFTVYSRTLRNPFVNYDDAAYVTENQAIQHGLTVATLRWAFTTTAEANWHPLTWLSHALDCQIFGLDPAGHHFTGVLLHTLNVLLLFLILQRATGATGRSLLVAALFALHPVNVESVAWIAERKNVLSMFFFLLTLGAYGWYARRPGAGRYLLVVLCFVLGLTAKPMIVTLPFVLLLVDFWPLQRILNWQMPSRVFPLPQAPFWRLVMEKVPLLLLSLVSSVVTMIAQRSVIAYNEHLPLSTRTANALYAYAMYVVKAFWPIRLAAFYPYQGFALSGWKILPCLAFLVVVTIWVWRRRSYPYLMVGWLWFLGTLIPMIGLVQVGDQAMADRYAYLPLIGIFVMVVWGAADWSSKRGFDVRRRTAVAALALAILAILSWRQIGFWHSSYDLWSHALQVTKQNYVAEDYAGSALLVKTYEASGQRYSDEALVHFQNAIRFNPKDVVGHLNLGADLHEHGRLQEAIQQYQLVLALTRNHELVAKALTDLGAAYQQSGDYATAQQYYLEALKMDPYAQTVLTNLGKLGMLERIQQLAAAAAAHPSPQNYLQLGQLQEAVGNITDARAFYQQALKLDPGMAQARKALDSLENKNKTPGRSEGPRVSLPAANQVR